MSFFFCRETSAKSCVQHYNKSAAAQSRISASSNRGDEKYSLCIDGVATVPVSPCKMTENECFFQRRLMTGEDGSFGGAFAFCSVFLSLSLCLAAFRYPWLLWL